MAIYNEILAARFARAIQKVFSMKGQNPSKQLSGEVMPVHPFASGVENRFPESWDRFGLTVNLTGAAGQFAALRMRNLPTSGIIAVVESVTFSNVAGNGAYQGEVASANLDLTGAAAASGRMDARTGGRKSILSNTTQLTLVTPVTAIQFNGLLTVGTQAQLIQNENQEITILPGDVFDIGSGNAAGQFIVSVIWRERPLEESERQ